MGFPFSVNTEALSQAVKIEPLPPAQPPTIKPPQMPASDSSSKLSGLSLPAGLAGPSALAPAPSSGGSGLCLPCRIHMQVTDVDIKELVTAGFLDCEVDANTNYNDKKHPIFKPCTFTLTYTPATEEEEAMISIQPRESPYSRGFHCDNFAEASIHDGDKRRKSTLRAVDTEDMWKLSFGAGIEDRHYDSEKDRGEFIIFGHLIELVE